MKQIMIATVPHSGTHSLMKHLSLNPREKGGPWNQFHCCKQTYQFAKEGTHEVITTFRNPYHVAATFANRRKISDGMFEKWKNWWKYWALSLPYATIYPIEDLDLHLNSSNDKLRLRQALDQQDFEKFHKSVPIKWIDAIKEYGVFNEYYRNAS